MADAPRETIRLDKWLWQARFFKTRSLAARTVAGGRVRLNAERIDKPARAVGPGDVLTFPQGARVRVVRVLAPGIRRGPAAEAATLFEDISPPAAAEGDTSGGPRPTKRDRRATDALRRPGDRPPLE